MISLSLCMLCYTQESPDDPLDPLRMSFEIVRQTALRSRYFEVERFPPASGVGGGLKLQLLFRST